MMRPLPDDLLKVPHRQDVPFARLTTLVVDRVCPWLFEPTTEGEAHAEDLYAPPLQSHVSRNSG